MRLPPVMIVMPLVGLAGCPGEPAPAELLRKADTFCRGQVRPMPVSTSSKNSDVAQFGSAELYFPYFRCLNDSDSGLGRPVMRAAPTVVIKDRSR
jgi:hypothetical protein